MYGDGTTPANQYGSQAGEAWAAGHTGSGTVYVGIIDEGVQWAHQDLAANIWTNPFDPADGIDNDGNGYRDDIRGWDFDGNNNTTYDGTQDDHGTHVAGTIGAVGGNGKGVAGSTGTSRS
jgi:subtilisin family serine protease